MSVLVNLFHCIGSSMLVVLIAYVLVDIVDNKRLDLSGLVGRIIILVLFMLALMRT